MFFRISYMGLLLLLNATAIWAAKPPESERADPNELVLIADFPSPYDLADIDLEALIWKPAGEGPFPAIIMMHGSGGLYYKHDDLCDDDDRSCWRLSGKLKYWGKQLSQENIHVSVNPFLVIAVDSHTPRGYDHRGVAHINAEDRPLNVSSYLGRPWDLYAALRYLQTRDDVNSDAIFALGFSDGGGAVLSSVAAADNAALINQSDWFQGINNHTADGWLQMQQIGLKGAVAYYPSCGFFGHFDEVYTNYAPLLIHTGLDDMTTPVTSCLERQAEALQLGVSAEDFKTFSYEGMNHGFDYDDYDTTAACTAARRTQYFLSKLMGDHIFNTGFEGAVCP